MVGRLRRFGWKVAGILGSLGHYFCVAHCTFEYVGDISICSGPSMEPTLHTDNILLTERISPRLQKIKKGDIVIAVNPNNPSQFVCKRIVGLPGDRMYGLFSNKTEVVPRGHVWLEGDNGSNSTDSRYYGPVPQGLIRSRAVYRIWPLDSIKAL